MITYVDGALFYSPARVLVNPVNTMGAMGTGLAYEFRRAYPEMYEHYRECCRAGQFDIGQLMLYRTRHKWILNFPIHKHWRSSPRTEWIEAGLQRFAAVCIDCGFTTVSFPALGAADGPDGGLDWQDEVRPLMEAYLGVLPASVYIHLPARAGDDAGRGGPALRTWLSRPPRRISFDQFWRDTAVLASRQAHFTPAGSPDAPRFRVTAVPRRGSQRASLKFHSPQEPSIFIPETALRDLWLYITRAGYVLPQNLPAGLEQYAPYLVSLLGELDYLRQVRLAPAGGEMAWGLHYVPPVSQRSTGRRVQLERDA